MHPSDLIDELRERCILCGRHPKEVLEESGPDSCQVVCEVCGRYSVTDSVFRAFRSADLNADMKPNVSAAVRRHFEYTNEAQSLTIQNYSELASLAPHEDDVSAKIRYLVEFIAIKSVSPGRRITLKPHTDYPTCFASSADELRFVIHHASEQMLVAFDSSMHDFTCWLTPTGWEAAKRGPTLGDAPWTAKVDSRSGTASYSPRDTSRASKDTPLPEWVRNILSQEESECLEFKERLPQQYDLVKQLSALSNTQGGLLVLGVREGGEIIGVPDPVRVETAIQSAARKLSPPVVVEVDCFYCDARALVVVKVIKSEQPTYTADRQAYQRMGDRVVRLAETDRLPKFDVFLAHNAKDKPCVVAMANTLRALGIRVWLDEEQIRPGQRFQQAIQQSLKNVRAVALVVGVSGLGPWQVEELRVAISLSVRQGVPVIPVLLPGVSTLPPDIPFLAEFGWVRFVNNVHEEANIARLYWGIMGRHPRSATCNDVAAIATPSLHETRRSTSSSPDGGIPGRSANVLFGLHGIRTHAGWARTLYEVGADAAWQVRMDRWNFGYFSLFQFLMPWARHAKLQWFRSAYTDEMENRNVLLDNGEVPSIVAHSFGTYILGNAMLKYDWLRFDKIILCGSILPTNFPWDKLIERGQVQSVRNEYGVRDIWSGLVRWCVAGTGSSGRDGFTCVHDRLVQEEFEYAHSEYFDKGHMRAKWLPFLTKKLTAISTNEKPVQRPKGNRPWALYAIYLLLIAALCASAWLGWNRIGVPRERLPDWGSEEYL